MPIWASPSREAVGLAWANTWGAQIRRTSVTRASKRSLRGPEKNDNESGFRSRCFALVYVLRCKIVTAMLVALLSELVCCAERVYGGSQPGQKVPVLILIVNCANDDVFLDGNV